MTILFKKISKKNYKKLLKNGYEFLKRRRKTNEFCVMYNEN